MQIYSRVLSPPGSRGDDSVSPGVLKLISFERLMLQTQDINNLPKIYQENNYCKKKFFPKTFLRDTDIIRKSFYVI